MSTVSFAYRFRALLFLAVGLAWSMGMSGCGGEEKTGAVVPADEAATAERNKSMEDYMKSGAGKAATKPK